MWRKMIMIVTLIILLISVIATAEVIDNRDNRQAYARSVSQLGMSGDHTGSSDLRLRKSSSASPTIVIFRILEGIPDLGQYTPDTLIMGPHGCFTAAYSDEKTAQEAIEYLRTLPDILYAELDGDVYASEEEPDPDDPEQTEPEEQYTFHSHGASEMGFGKAAPWCREAGAGSVTVAVIDSGVYPHPFLASRLEQSGFDYVDGDEDATNDAYGHGTHVAGIVVDCTPELQVYIRPIRILDATGRGSIANTTSAIFEAAEAGCDVINLSLIAKKHSDALEDAVKFALSCESSVVASAGNNGEPVDDYCPVHMDDAGLIVVGACTGSLAAPVQASYSNYGPAVDLFAFGSSIQSCSLTDGYTSKSGTSQAAPHISALCAILRQLFPSAGCQQTESMVKALAIEGNIKIPNAALLVPQTMGISGSNICLPVGTRIRLLDNALPETSFVEISWQCEDDNIATVDESGFLTCMEEGTTVLFGDGSVNKSVSVNLHVIPDDSVFHVPSSVVSVEAEAFADTMANAAYLPINIQSLEWNAFDNSNIKTIFYGGDNMLFDGIQAMNTDICIVTDKQKNLWSELEAAGFNYLLDCE